MKSTFYLCLLSCFVSSGLANPDLQSAKKIDEILSRHWQSMEVEAAPLVDDATFVRRAYLDVAGRIPTGAETRDFLRDSAEDKRARLIDSLLESEGYINHQFNFWADILRIHSQQGGGQQVVPAYIDFVRESIRENQPYDEFVRSLVAAEGASYENGAVGYYYRDRGMPLDHMANTVRIFLGTRLECAQCHNHPFDKWTQMDFYHMAAFSYGMNTRSQDQGKARDVLRKMQRDKELSAVERRKVQRAFQEIGRPLRNMVNLAYEPARLPQLPHDYQYDDAKPKEKIAEHVMFGEQPEISAPEERIEKYAEWMTSRDNPRFTSVIANRMWKKIFGLGLIEPVDEFTDYTTPAIPELMTYLEEAMRDRDYDLKRFQRMLLLTRAYQREAGTCETGIPATYAFTGPVARRMSAEQIWDSIVTLVNPDPEKGNWKQEQEAQMSMLFSGLMTEAIERIPEDQLMRKALEIVELQDEQQKQLAKLQKELTEAREKSNSEEVRRISRETNRLRQSIRDEVHNSIYAPALKKMKPQLIEVCLPEGETMAMKVDASQMSSNGRPPREMSAWIAKKEREMLEQEMDGLGITEAKERREYARYRQSVASNFIRAAHLSSPAPPGHFLRQFGQSDRETIENAETSASVPQALTLLNGNIFQTVVNPNSVISRAVLAEEGKRERIEMIYLSMLNRRPSAEEWEILQSGANERGEKIFVDLAFALLNTQEFLFIK